LPIAATNGPTATNESRSTMARSALLNVMVQAATKAGRVLARDFGEVQNLQVSLKGPGDYVSQADRKAEEILFNELSRARPGYSFLMEERGAVEGSDDQHRWIVDPLDGTTNFLHGIPVFAISIALERQGVLTAAVVYNPAMDELYTAERGGGAFLNDRRLRVAARRQLSDAVVGTGIPHIGRGHHGNYLVEMRNVMGEVAGVRRFGAVALDLAYVAAGRYDGFWESALFPWDIAAGALLIREAGGFITDGQGGQDIFSGEMIVAGNEIIHGALLKTLAKPIR
jgi:myo-inositol-1(or 4)-monophosphatase